MLRSKCAREGEMRLLSPPAPIVSPQSFVLIFLAEWGDRSQITTIAVR